MPTSASEAAFDIARLEGAVNALAAAHAGLRDENAELKRSLDESTLRVRALDNRLRAENQRRLDAVKRIDDVIAQLDHFRPELGSPPGSAQLKGAED